MRSLSLDRPGAKTLRLALVLLAAFMLVVMRMPAGAQIAEDATEPPADETTVTEGGEAATEEPAPDEEPVVVDDSDLPAEEEPPVVDGEDGEGTDSPVVELPDEGTPDGTTDEGTVDSGGGDEDTAGTDPAEGGATDELATTSADEPREVTAVGDAPDGGDFSINWLASEPFSYSHITGGGVFGSGGRDTTVESLNGGDFLCGDLVSYLAAISVDDSNATDAATLQFSTTFDTLTTNESGIGHEYIVRAVINSGDPGMDGDASVVSLDRSTSGGNLVGVVTVDDLEAGETIIVRIDVRLGCQNGGRNVGVIHASLSNIQVIAPTNETVPGGAQTLPFKQSGVNRELTITKVVSGPAPAGATYDVTVSCLKGSTANLSFTGSGTQSAGLIPEGDTCTVTETSDGGADRTEVSVNGGAKVVSHTTPIVIGATNNVTFTNTFLTPTVTVNKTADRTTVTPGGTITYTITARNTAASATTARNVVVSDDLDDDLANVAASYSVAGGASQPCTVGAGNTIECAVGNLAVGQAVVVTVTADATIAACGPVLNRASAVGTNFTAVQSSQVTVTVVCDPDLSLTKTASSTSVIPGEEFDYTLTATNPSTATAAAEDVVITDDLHNSLSGVSASFSVDGGPAQDCTVGAGNLVTCDVGTLDIDSSAVVTITATATSASCPSIDNTGVASGSNFDDVESDPVTVDVTCTPALTIIKTASATTVVPGESYDYTITVRSPSTATATSTNVVVIDDLNDTLIVERPTYSVAGGAAQDCDAVSATNGIRCAVGDLAPGQSAVVTISVTPTVESCGDVVNVASASATNIATAVGSDPVTVTVVCEPALVLDKTASAGTVDAGDVITYTITAENPTGSATAAAADVLITDDLDDDLIDVSATMSAGGPATPCPVALGNVVMCDAGDIAIGDTVVVTITATTTELACGEVTNVSSAAGANFVTVTSPTVNLDVTCPPIVGIVKDVDRISVEAGEPLTYTIVATNSADDLTGRAAKDVVITDDLDDTLVNVVAAYQLGAGPSSPCPIDAGSVVRCAVGDLVPGASVTVTITVTTTEESCAEVHNIATASGTNFITVPSEDIIVLVACPGDPLIEVIKTGVAPDRGLGDTITYTYVVNNIGSRDLFNVTLDDDILGPITLETTTLLIGESTTAYATATISAEDIRNGEVVNVATVFGTSPEGETVTDTDDEIILVSEPGIRVEKTPNVQTAVVGETVTYEYVITNIGTERLTDITLVDDKIGTIVSVEDGLSLEVDASTTVYADYVVTRADVKAGEVVNVAVVTGLPPKGPPVDDEDRAKIGTTDVGADGTLRIVKQVTGDGEPAAGTTFGFAVDCGEFDLGEGRDTFTLPADGGIHPIERDLPVGTQCTVSEVRTGGADATTVAVDGGAAAEATQVEVTITEDELITVSFVNTFGEDETGCLTEPCLPATGINMATQLLMGMAAVALGAALLRRFQPDTGIDTPRRRRGMRR